VLFGLPETLPAERRIRAGLGEALHAYGRLLSDGRYMGFALTGGLASAAMFAYISGSPFVFIELNGVLPEHYGLLFGVNAFGLILASQLNRRLLIRYTGNQILAAVLPITTASALLLLLVTALNIVGFPLMLVLIFICIASTGFIGPNATAAAMAPYGKQAGSASALLGAVQFGLGALAGVVLGTLHNGTALPMAATMALCGAASLIALHALALRDAPRSVTAETQPE
jgi:DHA1 family bicyclomycin/chloramphenicol resistance-like MFS transporter